MRRAVLFLSAAAALTLAPAAWAADPAEGDWMTVGGGSKVHIAPCAGQAGRLCGRIVWLKNPNDKTGQPAKDPTGRPVLGLSMISDFRPDGPGHWTGGKIYNPRDGKTYASKLSANPDGTLKVEGCVMVICQAQTWTRPGA